MLLTLGLYHEAQLSETLTILLPNLIMSGLHLSFPVK